MAYVSSACLAHIYCPALLLGKNGNVAPHTKRLDTTGLEGVGSEMIFLNWLESVNNFTEVI